MYTKITWDLADQSQATQLTDSSTDLNDLPSVINWHNVIFPFLTLKIGFMGYQKDSNWCLKLKYFFVVTAIFKIITVTSISLNLISYFLRCATSIRSVRKFCLCSQLQLSELMPRSCDEAMMWRTMLSFTVVWFNTTETPFPLGENNSDRI